MKFLPAENCDVLYIVENEDWDICSIRIDGSQTWNITATNSENVIASCGPISISLTKQQFKNLFGCVEKEEI